MLLQERLSSWFEGKTGEMELSAVELGPFVELKIKIRAWSHSSLLPMTDSKLEVPRKGEKKILLSC